MRTALISSVNRLEIANVPEPQPKTGEVVVAIRAAALNHRDVWIKAGQYAGLKWPCIPGSDGAGIVETSGNGAQAEAWRGREVIINPSFDWGSGELAQSDQFTILGLPRDGTLAERVVVPAAQVSARPAHLSWEEAAALPLAGLTAYRAVFSRARTGAGDRVLVNGIGGGVALFAAQFALAAGAEVWVTSSSREKIDKAVRLGAKGGFDYRAERWTEAAARSPGLFSVIIDGAGGPCFPDLLDLAAPGGRVVLFGATAGSPPGFPARKIFWRQLSLLGTTMGSPADWTAMLDFVERRRIRPIVSETFSLERAADAFALMERGGQFGKISIRIAD